MKTTDNLRYPDAWADLRPGEFTFSRRPFHVLERIAADLADRGITIELRPTDGGYHVACSARVAQGETL